MTSKERVLLSFDHQEPDLVPRWCGASPEFWEKAKEELEFDDEGLRIRFWDDFRRVVAPYEESDLVSFSGNYITPFRIEREGIGYGQPTCNPLAEASLKEVHDYPWPDPDKVNISNIRKEAMEYCDSYAILGGDWTPFWHDMFDMFGMESLQVPATITYWKRRL